MCGGRGTRLGGDREKPLVAVAGRSMRDRVLAARAAAERVETTHAIASPHAPATRERLVARREVDAGDGNLAIVDAPGDGYVSDLRYALNAGPTPPVCTVAADLPLLDGDGVDAVCDAHAASDADSLSVLVPAARKLALGASADAAAPAGRRGSAERDGGAPAECNGGGEVSAERDGDERAPAGINVVGELDEPGAEAVRVTDDVRVAVNVNYPADRRLAESLLGGDGPERLPDGGVDWLDAPEAETGGRP